MITTMVVTKLTISFVGLDSNERWFGHPKAEGTLAK